MFELEGHIEYTHEVGGVVVELRTKKVLFSELLLPQASRTKTLKKLESEDIFYYLLPLTYTTNPESRSTSTRLHSSLEEKS